MQAGEKEYRNNKGALSLDEPVQDHFLDDGDFGCKVSILNHGGYFLSYSLNDGIEWGCKLKLKLFDSVVDHQQLNSADIGHIFQQHGRLSCGEPSHRDMVFLSS